MQRKNSECRTTDCSPRSPSGGVIITWLLVLLSVEGGYYRVRKKRRSEVEKEAPVGAMVAVLGLFAFIQTDRSASALVRVSSDTP